MDGPEDNQVSFDCNRHFPFDRCGRPNYDMTMPSVRKLFAQSVSMFGRSCRICGLLLALVTASPAQTPEWIWHPNNGAQPADNETRYFKKNFTVEKPVDKAFIVATCDDDFKLDINDRRCLSGDGWSRGFPATVTRFLKNGQNTIIATGHNNSSAAGFVARLEIVYKDGTKAVIVTDASWQASDQKDPAAGTWVAVKRLGEMGVQPWGDVFRPPEATPAGSITVPKGFKVELLRSAQPEEGSWVAMTIDDKGRLIISPQEGSLWRATVPKKSGDVKMEQITSGLGSAMGLLYTKGTLFVDGRGPNGLGIYKLKENAVSDKFENQQFLKAMRGDGGEHGPHALVLGPDNMIYQVNGNFVKVVEGVDPNSPHKNYADDVVIPRVEDGNGFGVGNKPPGGQVLRFDQNGENWQLFAAGQRNDYDIAFNEDGELFGFDSDMEWDWGMPWYRPIRINHIVSGADFGFREGSAKWPVWYPDSLPSTVDVGIGSPTGTKFGTGSKFPSKYRRAMFAMDWAYGRIFAIHLAPDGASYSATVETFLRGKPLNVTDLEFGADGAMYFITGGRGTQSGLYRVTYDGPEIKEVAPTSFEMAERERAKEARALRHKIEVYQTKKDPSSIDFLWTNLKSGDRWIRYAARVALENQDVNLWQQKVFTEQDINAQINGTLALARVGDHSLEQQLIGNMRRLDGETVQEEQALDALRTLEVIFARMGHPDAQVAQGMAEVLNKYFPAQTFALNRELSQLLVYLESPEVAGKCLDLIDAADTLEEQIFYINVLRELKKGWTMEQHQKYFAWFNKDHSKLGHPDGMVDWFKAAGRDYGDGASFAGFMKKIKSDAVASLTDDERGQLAALIMGQQETVAVATKERKFVRDWTMADLVPHLDEASKGRAFERGREVFMAAQCLACHRFGNEGGAVGPDLTAVFTRFTRRDVLESIIEPSKVISEQYQASTLTLKNGDDVTGRIVDETPDKYVVLTDPLHGGKTDVKKADVTKREISKISPMPQGLVSIFTRDEIMELLAYLESAGKADAPIYKKN
jgi:putative heme-binding domain-containing protein